MHGLEVRLLQVDQNDVGQRTLADHAQFVAPSEGAGAVHGHHAQHLLRGHRAGIARGALLEECRRAHLLPHVEVVVRAGSVGGDRHQRTFAAHALDRRRAARQLHVALGVVRHRNAAPDERRDVLVAHVHAVRGDGAVVEHPQRIEVRDGALAVTLAHDTRLLRRLGRMGHEVQSVLVAEPLAAHVVFGRHGVGRMRRRGDADAVAPPGRLHGCGQRTHGLLHVRVEVAHAQHRTDAHVPHDLHVAVLVPVHVHERGHTPQQQFGHAQLRAEHHVPGALTRLERPDVVVEPRHEREIVGIASLQRHARMAVRVDQSGHQQLARGVDAPQAGMRRTERIGLAAVTRHEGDAPAVDADPAPKGLRLTGCHAQHGAIFE